MEKTNHVCPICGREFTASKTAKFCSKACRWKAFLKAHPNHRDERRAAYKKKQYKPIACPVCGTVFTPRRADQKYCSRKCKWHVENLKANVKRRNERSKSFSIGMYGLPVRKCELCGCSFSPSKRNQKRCRSCSTSYRETMISHMSTEFS